MTTSAIRVEQIGSLTRPESVLAAREDCNAGKLTSSELRAIEDGDGAHMTIDEQWRKLELIASAAEKIWG